MIVRKEWESLFTCYSRGRRYYSTKRLQVLQALASLIAEDTCIQELECLGLDERNINCLDKHGILFLAELVALPIKTVREIKNIGPKAVQQIRKAIYLLPEIEQRREDFMAEMMPNKGDLGTIRKYGLAAV